MIQDKLTAYSPIVNTGSQNVNGELFLQFYKIPDSSLVTNSQDIYVKEDESKKDHSLRNAIIVGSVIVSTILGAYGLHKAGMFKNLKGTDKYLYNFYEVDTNKLFRGAEPGYLKLKKIEKEIMKRQKKGVNSLEELKKDLEIGEKVAELEATMRKDIEHLKDKGIKKIVDLRNDKTTPSIIFEIEESIAKEYRIIYKRIPLTSRKAATFEQKSEFMRAVEDSVAYVHCRKGVDRTGELVTLYGKEKLGWSFEKAYQEMKDKGFNLSHRIHCAEKYKSVSEIYNTGWDYNWFDKIYMNFFPPKLITKI